MPTTPEQIQLHLLQQRLCSIKYFLVCDIDNTLTVDKMHAQKLASILRQHHQDLGFAVATGRNIDSALSVLKTYGYPHPDFLITSVGSEIHYGKLVVRDQDWAAYIKLAWKPKTIIKALKDFEEIKLQTGEEAQQPYKVSYTVTDDARITTLHMRIREVLHQGAGKQHIILSHDTYLDVLPYRASKGNAILYLARKWGIDKKTILTTGDSENDRDMFTKGFQSIIVANHEKSLDTLCKTKNRFFSTKPGVAGVLEGLSHFGVL